MVCVLVRVRDVVKMYWFVMVIYIVGVEGFFWMCFMYMVVMDYIEVMDIMNELYW